MDFSKQTIFIESMRIYFHFLSTAVENHMSSVCFRLHMFHMMYAMPNVDRIYAMSYIQMSCLILYILDFLLFRIA